MSNLIPHSSATALANVSESESLFDILMYSLEHDEWIWNEHEGSDNLNKVTISRGDFTISFVHIPIYIWAIAIICTFGILPFLGPGIYVRFKGKKLKFKSYQLWKIIFWYKRKVKQRLADYNTDRLLEAKISLLNASEIKESEGTKVTPFFE